jgi:predicted DNA-binding transcriptional regulator YafY
VSKMRGERATATYLFDPESIRASSEAPPDVARLVWMFLTLLRRHEVDFARFSKSFGGRSERTFKRDIAKLRGLGRQHGFALTPVRDGKVGLSEVHGLPDPREKLGPQAADALRAVAEALGEIVGADLLGFFDTGAAPRDPFLRLATPRLASDTRVAGVYRELRTAWQQHARVRFHYPKRGAREPGAESEERTVEPHLVTYYDGRYYLVAYDRRPRTSGWRQFALDRIAGRVARAGSFEPRAVPAAYRGEDALGLFKTGERYEVAIDLTPTVAQAVLARRWQQAQRSQVHADGSASIRFEVFDLGEAVRWALSFGAEARVVAPPEAVALAREIASAVLNKMSEARHTA